MIEKLAGQPPAGLNGGFLMIERRSVELPHPAGYPVFKLRQMISRISDNADDFLRVPPFYETA